MSPPSDNIRTNRFTLWAVIDGEKFEDIVAVSASFALNTIPSATITFAVGVDTESGGSAWIGAEPEAAEIHTAKAKKIKPRAKVEIYLRIYDGTAELEYKIFKGIVAGRGYQRSSNNANYSLHILHWLSDLHSSSMVHGDWYPGIGADWAQAAVYALIGTAKNTSAGTPGIAKDIANYDNMAKDVWLELFQKILLAVAAGPSLAQGSGAHESDSRNAAATEALTTMMPGKHAESKYVPLGMRLDAASKENLQHSLREYLDRSVGEAFAYHTFWAKLITEYAAQFQFAISPAVEWAIPIPFCGGLRATDGGVPRPNVQTIKANEYNYASFNAHMSQIIEGVYVFHPHNSGTGAAQPAANPNPNATDTKLKRPYAEWPKEVVGAKNNGMKLFKNSPAWMQSLSVTALGGLYSIHNVESGVTAKPPDPDISKALGGGLGVMVNWAKHWFYTELMQMRSGELSGALRFDIAPGSLVKIETPTQESEFRNSVASENFMVASVVSVSYVINAERAMAGTSFSLAHIRTPEEERDDAFTTAELPLYKEAWYGAKLAESK